MTEFSDLRACFVNTTLKPTVREPSHTKALMQKSMAIMEDNRVSVDYVHLADHKIAFGVKPDMRDEGAEVDDWPDHIWPRIRDAHILVVGTPLWLGEESSLCRVLIERLYAHSAQTNDAGQYIYYGKVGGCVVTGNEDGVKHAAMTIQYAMSHIGFTIPPQADCGWIGEIGPGASYGDDGAGLDNEFTKRNTSFMTWNLMQSARLLVDNGGFPAQGNIPADWEEDSDD